MPCLAASESPAIISEDRRREVVAIMARGLIRLRLAVENSPEFRPESPCLVGENTAQCDPPVNKTENERVTR